MEVVVSVCCELFHPYVSPKLLVTFFYLNDHAAALIGGLTWHVLQIPNHFENEFL